LLDKPEVDAMKKNRWVGVIACAGMVALGGGGTLVAQKPAVEAVSPATMARVGTVDPRFQSYNIEMVEVIGGRFWKPYAKPGEAAPSSAAQSTNKNQPVGMDPSLYQYRPPINLSNPRLRKLAAALGPAYVRVSGTWANSVYFQDSDGPAPATAPKGFGGVLTRQQWKGVIDFVHATDAKLVTSFATSVGTRDASGVWTSDQAQKLLDYTKAIGGSIAAAEYMNEPTFAVIGGAPKGYDAADFGRDIKVFLPFIRKAEPKMIFLGPGGVGEGGSLLPAGMKLLSTADLMKATGPVYDDFSYHFYGAVSQRCAKMGGVASITPEGALSEDWLGRAATVEKFYAGLRDEYEPGKAMWLTETADAACGGNPWASTFLDSFRYLDQHGQLAKLGVQVVMHNTLASSDYGLLDENTLAPRPNYWAALLWHQLMGTTVLDAGSSPAANLHLYAQCLQGHPGGVALLAINADREAAQELKVPMRSERYTLTAAHLMDTAVELNGKTLTVDAAGDVPAMAGVKEKAGTVMLAPESITFLAMPKAGNQSCR
jgi:heparanase 1